MEHPVAVQNTPQFTESFSIQAAFTEGWRLFTLEWRVLIVMQAIASLILLISGACVSGTFPGTPARLFATVLDLGLMLIMSLGLFFVYLRVYDGEKIELLDIFDPLPLFWGYAGVMLLVVLGVGAGLVFLVVPGVFLASGILLAPLIALETNQNPVEALRASWKKTENHKLNCALFLAVVFILNILGLMAFGLGVIVTIPLSGLAYAYVYRYFFPKVVLLLPVV